MAPVAAWWLAWSFGRIAWHSSGWKALSNEYSLRTLLYRENHSGPRRFAARDPLSERERWDNAMAEKYRRAALRPWLPVAPDPPYPK